MKLTNSKDYMLVATLVQILREGIRRFCEFCEFIFDVDSYVVRQLSYWDSHIIHHEHTYTSCQCDDKQFSCKVAYAILLHNHIFLQSCINAHDPSDVSFPTFTNLQSSTVFRNLSTILPRSFQQSVNSTSKRKNNDDNNEGSKHAKTTDIVCGDPDHNIKPTHPGVLKKCRRKLP